MPITQWPVWYARKTIDALGCRRGMPLPVQNPGSIRQLAVGFGKPMGCALSDTLDVFECVEVPNRPLALQAVRERWSKRRLLAACAGEPAQVA